MNAPIQLALLDRHGGPATETRPAPAAATHSQPAPMAANTDPLSSHLAGAAIRASGADTNQMSAIVDWLRANAREPLTSHEIAEHGNLPGILPGGVTKTRLPPSFVTWMTTSPR